MKDTMERDRIDKALEPMDPDERAAEIKRVREAISQNRWEYEGLGLELLALSIGAEQDEETEG